MYIKFRNTRKRGSIMILTLSISLLIIIIVSGIYALSLKRNINVFNLSKNIILENEINNSRSILFNDFYKELKSFEYDLRKIEKHEQIINDKSLKYDNEKIIYKYKYIKNTFINEIYTIILDGETIQFRLIERIFSNG